MPSFDIVSNIDQHEIANAVDQANRELNTRFDFKDIDAQLLLSKEQITISAPSDFQLKQIDEILRNKLTKRQVDLRVLTYQDIDVSLSQAKQVIDIKQGIDQEQGKKITKLIKEAGLKVQASIQGDQVRVTSKKRDDLQEVMAFLRGAKLDIPVQFTNFRD